MSMTDPIADMLTRIRNANRVGKKEAKIPFSSLKVNILKVLKQSGFIEDYDLTLEEGHGVIRCRLKYGPDGECVIRSIQRVSKPGRRVYRGATGLAKVVNGMGVAVVSTPLGVLSDEEARRRNVGGEVLCEVW
ncbi:MAG: 30S ribosomal protein S8 [Planctomycetes bacterium]|nr:30S ribosomal protein S8 [Planctomycetota bacterium]